MSVPGSPDARLAPLYGLVIAMLPCMAAMQEFFWRMHPLQYLAMLVILLAAVVYSRREYLTQRDGQFIPTALSDLEPAGHLKLLAIFMLVHFGLVRLIYALIIGNKAWGTPSLLDLAGIPVHPDYIYYALELIGVVAVLLYSRRITRVRFHFNLKFRFLPVDILITVGFLALTFGGLYGYQYYFGENHGQWSPFGISAEMGRSKFLVAGALFAVVNALQEELWFRGVLLGSLRTLMRARHQVLLQGLVFGLIHWYGTPQGIMGLVLAGGWGVLLGAWTWRRRSLWPAFIVHVFADWLIFAYTAAKSGSLLAN
ncbi:MAG: CPBP family intramembrane metalloprotease [Planctomycetales bacterium]|nr:CPBP family intramembrane metalloprotease [bacterium]UNM08345.1 MAG: CPBP family intramembrane metalloprotease [Planctomycetales bacterium]